MGDGGGASPEAIKKKRRVGAKGEGRARTKGLCHKRAQDTRLSKRKDAGVAMENEGKIGREYAQSGKYKVGKLVCTYSDWGKAVWGVGQERKTNRGGLQGPTVVVLRQETKPPRGISTKKGIRWRHR